MNIELTDDEFEKYKMLDLRAEMESAMEHIEKCRLTLQRLEQDADKKTGVMIMDKKKIVRSICEAMATIEINIDEALFNEFEDCTTCESLTEALRDLGVKQELLIGYGGSAEGLGWAEWEVIRKEKLRDWINQCVDSLP